jgi:hypothetical protein
MAPAFTASGHKAKTEIFDEFRLGTFSHSRGHKAPPGFVTAAAGSPSKRPCWWAAMSHVWYGRRPRCKRNVTISEAFGCSHVSGPMSAAVLKNALIKKRHPTLAGCRVA